MVGGFGVLSLDHLADMSQTKYLFQIIFVIKFGDLSYTWQLKIADMSMGKNLYRNLYVLHCGYGLFGKIFLPADILRD